MFRTTASLRTAVAGENTAAVSAAATVCGSGYAFRDAVALPSATNRLGTLFVYEKGSSGCAIMDNNTSGAKVNSFACAPVTAKMGTSSSSLYFTYTSERLFPCG